MNKFGKIICIAAAFAAACACQPKLVIIHVNDTHSHFEPLRTGDDKGKGGVIERAAFVDSVRARYGSDKVLLLHAGDFSQGTSYFTELEGQLEPKVINDFHYDVVTLGNHEFDNDLEALEQRLSLLTDTKVVCANIDFSQFGLSKYVTPYTIVERGGMKIGVIGLAPDLLSNVARPISSRLTILDNVEVTNKWAEYLKKEEKCDMIILLSHLGYQEDLNIVPVTHYLNIVIGGHSHTFVDGFKYVKDADGKKVPVIQDGCWGLEMGEIKVW